MDENKPLVYGVKEQPRAGMGWIKELESPRWKDAFVWMLDKKQNLDEGIKNRGCVICVINSSGFMGSESMHSWACGRCSPALLYPSDPQQRKNLVK